MPTLVAGLRAVPGAVAAEPDVPRRHRGRAALAGGVLRRRRARRRRAGNPRIETTRGGVEDEIMWGLISFLKGHPQVLLLHALGTNTIRRGRGAGGGDAGMGVYLMWFSVVNLASYLR